MGICGSAAKAFHRGSRSGGGAPSLRSRCSCRPGDRKDKNPGSVRRTKKRRGFAAPFSEGFFWATGKQPSSLCAKRPGGHGESRCCSATTQNDTEGQSEGSGVTGVCK